MGEQNLEWKDIKSKIITIIVCMLFNITALPALGIINGLNNRKTIYDIVNIQEVEKSSLSCKMALKII